MIELNDKSIKKKGKDKKRNTYYTANALYESRELTLNALKSEIFLLKATQLRGRLSNLATRVKIVSLRQMVQRLTIALEITK